MKRVIVFLLMIVLFPYTSVCQNLDKILSNKSIVWAAEATTDYIVDDEYRTDTSKNNRIVKLKLINYDKYPIRDNFLFDRISEAFTENKLDVYADNKYQTRIGARVDSIEGFNPIDLSKKRYLAISKSLNMRFDRHFIRVIQILYYNQKKSQFGLFTKGIAYCHSYYDYLTGDMNISPYYWFIPSNKPARLKSKHITWAQRLTTLEKTDIDLTTVKTLKGKDNWEAITDLFKKMSENPKKIKVYDRLNTSKANQFSIEKVKNLFAVKSDTMPKYDDKYPQAPTHEYILSNCKLLPMSIKKLRIAQDWYWDNRKKQICINLVAVAPLAQGFEYIEYYTPPLFYLFN